jgi:prepilin-type N-terminal cleavage/methylation domain-containing protein/prepilin-type processing-associated H-X9-DG protein
MTRPAPTRARARGFTLVELLVVIAIIAVLVALLLPAMSAARRHTNLVRCSNNLREIGHACLMYANENRDLFPDPGKPTPATSFRLGTLANFGYRRALGFKKADDPSSYPEWLGLPAVLHGVRYGDFDRSVHSQADVEAGITAILDKPRYLHGQSKLWVCPAAPEDMQEFGNTYQWSGNDDFIRKATSVLRGKFSQTAQTTYLNDNRTLIPYLPGFILAGTSTGYSAKWPWPHKLGSEGKINLLYLDGHVALNP